MVHLIGNVQPPIRAELKIPRVVQTRLYGRTAVTTESRGARARHGIDPIPFKVHTSNPLIVRIGNKELAIRRQGQSASRRGIVACREVQLRQMGRTAVATESGRARTHHRGNDAIGIDFSNAQVALIQNIERIAGRKHRLRRIVQKRIFRRATVARKPGRIAQEYPHPAIDRIEKPQLVVSPGRQQKRPARKLDEVRRMTQIDGLSRRPRRDALGLPVGSVAHEAAADGRLQRAIAYGRPTHAMVVPIQNINPALGRDHHIHRPVERGQQQHVAVSVPTRIAGSRPGADRPGRVRTERRRRNGFVVVRFDRVVVTTRRQKTGQQANNKPETGPPKINRIRSHLRFPSHLVPCYRPACVLSRKEIA